MNREDFLSLLSEKIAVLPAEEKNKVYEYYNEIILDKKEGGLEETDIIAEFGDIDDIAAKLLSEFPEAGKRQETADTPGESSQQSVWPYPAPSVYVPALQKRSGAAWAWLIVLTILTSPIWLTLIVVSFVLLLCVIVVIISLLLSLWATAAALIISGLFCFGVSFTLFPQEFAAACFNLGISAFCIGLGCLLTAGMVKLTQLSFRFLKWMFQKIANLFHKKQDVLAERSPIQ